MTNEELAAAVQGGERERLPELWAQVERFIRRKAIRRACLLGGRGGVTADDLYQSGYFALLAAMDSYAPTEEKSFIGWLALHRKTAFAEAAGYRTVRQKRDPLHTAGSLDGPVSQDMEDVPLADVIPDPAALAELEAVEDRDRTCRLAAALGAALDTLPEDERAVMVARYYQGRAFKDIGQDRGVTSGRIQQLEQRAMRALRHPRNSQVLREYR